MMIQKLDVLQREKSTYKMNYKITEETQWTMKLNDRDYLFMREISPIVNTIAVVVKVYKRDLRFENCRIMISKDGKTLASKVYDKLIIGRTKLTPRTIIQKGKVSYSISISFDANNYVINYESSGAQLTLTPNGDNSIVTGKVISSICKIWVIFALMLN